MLRDRDGWTWHRRRLWIAIEIGLTNGGNVLSAGGGAAKETIIIGCHGDGIKVKLCMSMEHRSIVTSDCTLISSYNRSMYMYM